MLRGTEHTKLSWSPGEMALVRARGHFRVRSFTMVCVPIDILPFRVLKSAASSYHRDNILLVSGIDAIISAVSDMTLGQAAAHIQHLTRLVHTDIGALKSLRMNAS